MGHPIVLSTAMFDIDRSGLIKDLKEICTRKMKQTKIVVIFPLIPTVKFPRFYSVGKLVKIKPEK